MSRKVAREIAMKSAYARLLGGEGAFSSIPMLEDVVAPKGGEDAAFADDILEGIAAHEAELDELIAKYAIGWSIERIPKVDLCVLRIALYEMLYRDDITHSVSINEAVELAKRFGGDKSGTYINGVLGSVSQALSQV